ncbi:efflux transporter outer membrane subunit [Rhizosaccharibacter radicis]|uniref:Efflux transporter outer membrane subunit n=1 Tax=Rhizosaccharibacter radicis TaxID=2782605 RepID=A0ABT1VXN8_9PROT|nr:efflux transporter outer membrane subunit [Acetobacteraceae bacterium KSS12]
MKARNERSPRRTAGRGALLLGAAAMALSGCDLAPTYREPSYLLPSSYQGSGPFKLARPGDALPRGPWWELFGDPELDALEVRAVRDNPTLAAVAEQYTQARDLAAEARSGLFPQVAADGTLSRSKRSQGRPYPGTAVGTNIATLNQIDGAARWEPDFWSRIRNQTLLQKRLAQADAADLASARLSLQAELATDFIAIRGLDTEIEVYKQSIGFYQKAVDITRLRFLGKISSGLDVARAESQLATTQALLTDTVANRAVLQHAIAVLVGADPSSFVVASGDVGRFAVPEVPVGVPSSLLQRRPDVAAAERRMAAANAAIGVSRAAFFPDITLSAIGGFQDTGFDLASLPNSLWTVGATAFLPLFTGGLRRAELQRSWSQFRQTRDDYRATVLGAFQEVEDGLTLTGQLSTERAQQRTAVQAALQAQNITLQLYTGGLTNYLDAVVAQVTALTARIAEVEVQTRQLQASVTLVRGLGGGWTVGSLPTENGVLPFHPLAITGSDREPRPDGTGAGTEGASRPPGE